jgi:cyclopropane-fatty-acyl-phospholipid synthase
MSMAIELMERGLLPDFLVRTGIRQLLARRLKQATDAATDGREQAFIDSLRTSPVALATDKANEQHYELPAEFFHTVLGPRLKYSSCLWPEDQTTLGEAEELMLQLTGERAGLQDGHQILELGCGWGSLTLWMAEHFPHSQITAVSNSHSQRAFIEARADQAGRRNVRVITADMNEFSINETFDRVVSVEMFEHMRNYEELLKRVAGWLKPDGRLFLHIFCHRDRSYPFTTEGDFDWMGKYFFTGGLMPAEHLLDGFRRDLTVESQWPVNGRHYARTLRAWLDRMDQQRGTVMPLLQDTYGPREAQRWFHRWRVFFIACEELFAYRGGQEWYVTHLLLRRVAAAD